MWSFFKKKKHSSTPVTPFHTPYVSGPPHNNSFISCNAVWPWDDSGDPVLVTVNPLVHEDLSDEGEAEKKPVTVQEEESRSEVLFGAFQTRKLS
jgi:hypothetical protein